MNKFNKSFRGYNKKEVNKFLDDIISQVEKIVADSKSKDKIIMDLQGTIAKYKSIEASLNTSVVSAQENAERLRQMAKQEGSMIVNETKRNANKKIRY